MQARGIVARGKRGRQDWIIAAGIYKDTAEPLLSAFIELSIARHRKTPPLPNVIPRRTLRQQLVARDYDPNLIFIQEE
jgi:hypothetical protein